MPFSRPTLADLVTRIRGDFKSRLTIAGELLRRAMADVLAVVWAGAVHLTHGHLEWLGKQLIADTAEETFLVRLAGMWGITKTAATFATGSATATGTNGTDIPDGSILVRDDGARYETTALVTIAGGTATLALQALEAGDDGNMASGTLTFESPIANVDATVTLTGSGLTGGNDEETTEALRTRFILRLSEPPEGGADQDYEAWALEVAGVTRVFIYRHESGLGTVTVRFVRDDDGDGSAIIPDAGEVTAVQTAIDAERPVTAEVTVAAPTALTQAFTIGGVPAASQDAVEEELKDLFRREGEPGDGAGRGTIYRSQIISAIGLVDDLENFTVTVPAGDVVPALGQIPIVGAFTFT